MGAGFDTTCPACRRSTPPASASSSAPGARVCCARCAAYHHAECWGFRPGCAACGGTESLGDRDARRQGARARRRTLLAALTLGLLAAALVPLRAFGWVQLGGVELDALRIGLVVLAVVTAARLAPN